MWQSVDNGLQSVAITWDRNVADSALSGTERHSAALSGTQRHSAALRVHRLSFIAISRHPPKSFEVCTLGVSRLGGLDRSTQLLLIDLLLDLLECRFHTTREPALPGAAPSGRRRLLWQ